jgi:hypothetical protein
MRIQNRPRAEETKTLATLAPRLAYAYFSPPRFQSRTSRRRSNSRRRATHSLSRTPSVRHTSSPLPLSQANPDRAGVSFPCRFHNSDLLLGSFAPIIVIGWRIKTPRQPETCSHIAKIALLGNYLASTFVASSDGYGGTNIIDPATAASTNSSGAARSGRRC